MATQGKRQSKQSHSTKPQMGPTTANVAAKPKAARRRNGRKYQEKKRRPGPPQPSQRGPRPQKKPRQPPMPKILRTGKLRHKGVDAFLQAVMLDECFDNSIAPVPTTVCNASQVASYKISYSTQLDLDALAVSLNAEEVSRPTINYRGSSVEVWSRTKGVWPCIQMQDHAFPLCAPMPMIIPNGYQPKRFFSYLIANISSGMVQADPNLVNGVYRTNPVTADLHFSSVGRPVASDNNGYLSTLQPGWNIRPLFANRGLTDAHDYFWIDAADTDTLRGIVHFAGFVMIHNDGTHGENHELVVEVLLTLHRLNSNGTEETISETYMINDPNQDEYTDLEFDLGMPVGSSGFYRAEVTTVITGANSEDLSIAGIKYSNMVLTTREFTNVSTGWLANTQFIESAPAMASSYWPIGTGVLCSCESPPLTTAGRVQACNFADIDLPMFYQASALSMGDVMQKVASSTRKYNNAAGGPLIKGLWAFVNPSTWYERMLPVSVPSYDGAAACRSYWPGLEGSPGGNNILWFTPNTAQYADSVYFRFSVTVTGIYTVKTQFVAPSAKIYLLPDHFDAARVLLQSMPQFSENDWHTLFQKLARAAGSLSEGLAKGADFVLRNAPQALEVVAHAKNVAMAVSALAALIL